MDTPTAPEPEPATDEETLAPLIAAPPHGGHTLGYVFAAVGATLFSTKAIAIKLAYGESVDATTLLALRMALSSPFYLAIGLYSLRDRSLTGRPLPTARLVGAAGAVGLLGYWIASYLDFLGLESIPAQYERLILFTYPLFVVIFGALFFRQPVTRRVLVAIGISYLGLVVIFSQNAVSGGRVALFGAVMVLGAAVAFALYQLFAKDLIAAVGPRLFTCISMAGAALGAFLQFFLTHPAADLAVNRHVWVDAIFLAIGATVLPSFFLNAALHRISAQANATIGTVSPVATILLAYAVLGERLTPLAVLGTILVLAGVGWFTLGYRRARDAG